MSETDSPGPFVNPFKLIPTADKRALRLFLASAVVAKLKRPLSAPERLLAAAGVTNPLQGFSAALLAEAILEDPGAAAALKAEDPELFAAAEEFLAPKLQVPAPRSRKRGPKPLLDADIIVGVVPATMAAINAAAAISNLNIPKEIENLKDLGDALKGIGSGLKDVVGGAKSILDIGKDARKAYKKWGRENRGKPGDATGEEPGDQDDKVPYILPDEFADLFGEMLPDEPLYSVWLDQVGALEVDGAGDDNIFWVAQSFVHLKDPNKIVVSASISQEYDLDEFNEARLSPLANVLPGRGPMVDHPDWTVVHRIRDRDAILAIRQGNRTQSFPLSHLKHIELFIDVYDNDKSKLAEAAIAAIITAVLAAMAFYSGKVTPSIGSTVELTRANQDAIEKLFALINSEDLLLEGVFMIYPADFEEAFANGTKFSVIEHRSEAAAGRPSQRQVQAWRENGSVLDTVTADAFNSQNQARLNTEEYWENEFESYYEIRLRYERRSQS